MRTYALSFSLDAPPPPLLLTRNRPPPLQRVVCYDKKLLPEHLKETHRTEHKFDVIEVYQLSLVLIFLWFHWSAVVLTYHFLRLCV
jgi:hypothetical protein